MAHQIVICKYCTSDKVVHYGTQSGHDRYRCKDCGRIFKTDYTYRAYDNVTLKNLPMYGPLTPGKVAIVKITGEGGLGGIGPVIVKNDSGFDITDLHWKIPTSEEIRGKKVVGEDDVPNNWNQPDVQFGDKNNNKQVGESDIFKKITPKGVGPTKELIFEDGVIKIGLAALAVGLETLAEGADGGVERQGREHGHVKRLAQERVAGLGQPGLPGPLARLAQPRGQPGEGCGLLGVVEAAVFAEEGYQPRGGGLPDAGDGFEQFGAALEVGMAVDVAADLGADGLDFLVRDARPTLLILFGGSPCRRRLFGNPLPSCARLS
jgi:hypothetical protein